MAATLHVTDLDGTLLWPQARLAEGHAERVRRLVDDGVVLSYATARSYLSASRVTAACGFREPVIVYGGAATVEAGSGAILRRRVHEPAVVEVVLERCRAHGIPPLVYHLDGDADRVTWVEGQESPGMVGYIADRMPDPRFRPVARDLPTLEVFYLTIIGEETPVRRLAADLDGLLGSQLTAVLQRDTYHPSECWLELTAPGADKGTAVRELRERLGAGDTVVFGDNINDLPMFEAADHAVAMAWALPEVRAAADEVLEGGDTVVDWLERNAGRRPSRGRNAIGA